MSVWQDYNNYLQQDNITSSNTNNNVWDDADSSNQLRLKGADAPEVFHNITPTGDTQNERSKVYKQIAQLNNIPIEQAIAQVDAEAEAAKVDPNLGLRLIACNGIATVEQLKELKAAGVDNYNHNLETSRDFYPTICTTHTWDERYQTCLNVKEAGLKLVCGGIFGMGETQEDRISMIEAINSLDPMNVPLNFFHPNAALPIVENTISREEAFDLITLARKMIPNAHKIMVAGGRELMFGDEQYEIFKRGANAFVIGDYLTTAGKTPKDDVEALESFGYKIAKNFHVMPDEK